MKGLYIRSVYFLGLTSGGSVTHTAGVINAMRRNIDLEVISNDRLHEVEPPVRMIPAILRYIPVFNELLYNFWLVRLLKNDVDADFIYQRYSGESFCGARLAKIHNIPFVLEFNSSEVWKLKNWSKTKNPIKNVMKKLIQLPITRKVESYNLENAELIVVVSETLKENLVAEGIDGRKILVNPNGVEASRFDEANGDYWSEKYNLKDVFVFGFIGTFGKWHGVLELAQAIVKFYAKHPELTSKVKFLIIGEGKLFKEFLGILKAGGIGDQVICTGSVQQSESPGLLTCCDAFLSPHIKNPDGTKFFGSPTKLFEYMACRKPIIASDLDQIGEILTDDKTALLVEPNNIDQLTTAMHRLYNDADLRDKLASNARKLVEEKYSWDQHVKNILGRIEKLS